MYEKYLHVDFFSASRVHCYTKERSLLPLRRYDVIVSRFITWKQYLTLEKQFKFTRL